MMATISRYLETVRTNLRLDSAAEQEVIAELGTHIEDALEEVCSIIIQSIKGDWLSGALMLLPMPIILGWFLVVAQAEHFPKLSLGHIYHFAPWIGLSFLTLGVTAAIFFRLRQRWARVLLLLFSGLISLFMLAGYAEGRLSFLAFAGLILVMLGLLLSPALVERRLRYIKP